MWVDCLTYIRRCDVLGALSWKQNRPDYGAIGIGVAPQDLTQRSLLMCTQKERLGTHNMLRTIFRKTEDYRKEEEERVFLCV